MDAFYAPVEQREDPAIGTATLLGLDHIVRYKGNLGFIYCLISG